jgi:hypothetical protein
MKNEIPSIVFWDICVRFWDTEKWQNSESSPVKQAKDFMGQGKQKVEIRTSERRGDGLSDSRLHATRLAVFRSLAVK